MILDDDGKTPLSQAARAATRAPERRLPGRQSQARQGRLHLRRQPRGALHDLQQPQLPLPRPRAAPRPLLAAVLEDRADVEGLFEVAVAALDDLLVFVEAQQAPGREAPFEVGRERVDPVAARGLGDRILGALVGEGRLALAGCDPDDEQPLDVLADDLPDTPLDLGLGLVVAAAQPALDARKLRLGFLERALPG